ncbi:hypothetical protein L195_g030874 [Trifolium pratense]|uniref:Uncharacterized protein n=1 Tax=Trifolium pratense TaxID=57577 RepID=A0A2K3L8T2_TRIPR|nr:hypothetical protein L195_g030874 [Trifolium pratense]
MDKESSRDALYILPLHKGIRTSQCSNVVPANAIALPISPRHSRRVGSSVVAGELLGIAEMQPT